MAKQWYNYERPTFHFVRVARELQTPLTFRKVSDFDKNGIIYWIGSNARWVSRLQYPTYGRSGPVQGGSVDYSTPHTVDRVQCKVGQSTTVPYIHKRFTEPNLVILSSLGVLTG